MLSMLPAGGTKHQCPHESSPTHLFSLLIHIFFHAYFIHFRTRLLVKFYPFQHAVSFLSDLREVLGFWCCVRIEFSHWDAPGCDLGAKHGCWVNNRRRAHLQTRTPASTWNPLHCTALFSIASPRRILTQYLFYIVILHKRRIWRVFM